MMDMTLSEILSAITVIIALVMPVITAHINNKAQLKNKYIDVFYQQKFTLYKTFSEAYALLQHGGSINASSQFNVVAHEVMLVCCSEIRKSISDLLDLIFKNNGRPNTDSDKQFDFCCELLHNDLNSYSKNKK